MKVIAINSSPLTDKGNTHVILKPFLEGMEEAGAEVELIYPIKLNIKPCHGEFHCWFTHPGECFQKDDMQEVLPKLDAADVWVIASPLYVDGVSGTMKALMDRIIPLAEPWIELRDDHCRHPQRNKREVRRKLALVSNSGFWELDNFDSMVQHMKAVCKNMDADYAGALLRPHGGGLRNMLKMGMPMDDILQAAKDAGRQLIEEGVMAQATLDIVSRELMPRDMYLEGAKAAMAERLEKGTKAAAKRKVKETVSL